MVDSVADKDIQLAFLKQVRSAIPDTPVQVMGVNQDTANEESVEWITLSLLGTAPWQIRQGSLRTGVFQASCFSRFTNKSKQAKYDRCWEIADLVRSKLKYTRLYVENQLGDAYATLVTDEGATTYLPEDDIIKPKLGRNLEPSGVHGVIVQVRFIASLC